MKNISILFVLSFLFFAQFAWAQPTFYISPEFQLVDKDDQVCYELKTRDFSFILSTSFTIQWDPGVANNAFIDPSSLHPEITGLDMSDFMVNNDEGYLTFDWSNGQPCDTDDPSANETIDDEEVIFEFCFTAVGVYGNHTAIEIVDEPVDIVVKRYNTNCQNIMPGSVGGSGNGFTFDAFLSIGTEPLIVNISSADGFQGDNVCIDFTVENFDNLVSTQYYIFWDPNILLFESALPSGLPAFSSGSLGLTNVDQGMIAVSWNAVGNPVSVPDGTQILELCFKIIGSCGQSSPIYIDDSAEDEIEIIDGVTVGTNGTNIGLLDNPGEVSVKCFNPNGINMTIEDKDVCPGETFTVDITVSNFDDVAMLQYGLKWNPSIIQLLNTSDDGISFPPNDDDEPCFQYDSPGTLKTFPSLGRIEVDWNGGFWGCSLFDGEVLMRLHFRAVGPGGTNSTISVINPILVDLVGGQVQNVGINNDNGFVSICELTGPTLIAASDELNPGENVCVEITALDFQDITGTFYNISWEPAILSYTGVQNFNLPGLGPFNFIPSQAQTLGDLGVGWDSNTPVSVPDGTVLFEICFDVIGNPDSCSAIQFTDNFVPIEILTAQSNGTDVGLNGQQGEVCVLDPFDFFMSASDVFGQQGQQVYVDVFVENFIQLKRLKHSINWTNSIIQYDSLVSTGAIPGFNNTHFDDSPPDINNGQMIVDWSTNDINGVTVPDGTSIFRLYFTILGNPGQCSGVKINDWTTAIVVNSALTGNANLGMDATDGSVCVSQSFISVVSSVVTEVDCPSTPNGSIDLTMEGGSGNYNYSWIGAGVVPNNEDQFGLSAGPYAVTVTDIDNPSLKAEMDFQIVLSPNAPIADAGVDTSFSCVSGVSTLTLNGSGSTQTGVTYFWENSGSGFPGIIVSDTTTLHPTVIGGSEYTLTVTQTATGCVVQDVVNISSPIHPTPYIVDTLTTEISCAEDSIHLNGGMPQFVFNFEWIAGTGGNIVPGTESTMQPIVTEPAWYYLRMWHPFTGCEETDSIFIEENRIDPIANAGQDTLMRCGDSEIVLDGSNSTMANTTFQWVPIIGGEICGPTNQPNINACTPGTYQLAITDTLNGCVSLDELVIVGDTLRPDANAGLDTALTCIVDEIMLDGTGSSQGADIIYTWLDPMKIVVGNAITLSVAIPGIYTLEVEDTSNNCVASSEVEVINNQDFPNAIAVDDLQITCNEDTATLDGTGSSTGVEFIYEWMSQTAGLVSTDLMTQVTEPGTYTLTVTNTENDCQSDTTIIVEDLDDPIPVDVGLDTFIGCADILLEGSFTSNNQNPQIQWSGPGINCITDGTSLTPTIACPGVYKMIVFDPLTGCLGEDSLTVNPDMEPPMISAGDDADFPCSVDELELNGTSDITDVTIIWEGNDPITNANTLSPTIIAPGVYELTVTSNLNNCSSSDIVNISAPTLPTALIEGDTMVDCADPTLTLSGAGSSPNVTYFWVANSGGIIPAGQEMEAEVTVPAGGYVLTVTDDLGCTGTTSHIVDPNMDQPIADAGSDAEIPCNGNTATLDASGSDAGMTYLWADAQNNIVGTGLTVQVSESGIYTLTVTNPDNQCQGFAEVVVNMATAGDTLAEASFDHDPCELEAMLLGNLPAGATGVWTTSSGAAIEDATAETTLTTGLNEGDNIFNWTLSLGTCENYSTAQVIIDIDQSVPSPVDDETVLVPGTKGEVAFNVLENDVYDPALTTFNVLTADIPGEVNFTADGIITYNKIKCFVGVVEIEYELCNNNCPELCQTAILSITVEPDEDDACGEAPNGITPNGDGVNDELVFDELLNTTEEYPNNEIIIFNRWGDVVYQAKPYQNDWSGENNGGNQLPHATYYYILRLDLASGEIIRGDVTIMK